MFYYIHQNSIIFKSPMRLSNPQFIFDQVIQKTEFGKKDKVIFENGDVVLMENSKKFKDLSGASELEKENAKLKVTIEKQAEFTSSVVNSFKILDEERRALLARKK